MMVNASPPGTKALVDIAGVSKSFRSRHSTVTALGDVSMLVQEGEFVVLLGPSGCGKTTLLRSVAGLEKPDRGRIEIAGRTVFDSAQKIAVPPENRGLSMVFQSYALWPHMTVFDNIAYPLRNRKRPDVKGHVGRALEMVRCGELASRYPGQLSGGQQQRVALARALASGDQLILFDEPLSNVDAKVREAVRFELLNLQRELGFSALYVTHDQSEATALAHKIVVMRQGAVAQIGTPRAKLLVPSIGSMIQRRFDAPSLPYSSPSTASCGRAFARWSRTILSTRVSASVTIDLSGFVWMPRSCDR